MAKVYWVLNWIVPPQSYTYLGSGITGVSLQIQEENSRLVKTTASRVWQSAKMPQEENAEIVVWTPVSQPLWH